MNEVLPSQTYVEMLVLYEVTSHNPAITPPAGVSGRYYKRYSKFPFIDGASPPPPPFLGAGNLAFGAGRLPFAMSMSEGNIHIGMCMSLANIHIGMCILRANIHIGMCMLRSNWVVQPGGGDGGSAGDGIVILAFSVGV